MRKVSAAALAGLMFTSQAIGAARPPLRPAHADAGCLDNSRPLSHAAYTPDRSMPARSCGHLLSTDTVVRGNPWNRT